jgi:hypothetical protein
MAGADDNNVELFCELHAVAANTRPRRALLHFSKAGWQGTQVEVAIPNLLSAGKRGGRRSVRLITQMRVEHPVFHSPLLVTEVRLLLVLGFLRRGTS